jgi:hypothetical protein
MNKILAGFLTLVFLFVTMAPSADAASRVRKTLRNTHMTTPYAPQYQMPVYQTLYYQSPKPVYSNSAGSTYYYSSSYIAGYTYYSTPTPGYYYYSNTPAQTVVNTATQQGQYYYSPNYIAGYSYYPTPTPGYYYYHGSTAATHTPTPIVHHQNNANLICTIVGNIYQCTQSTYGSMSSIYPGCNSADIIIGGQIWASCNALDRNAGSTSKSGWFFAWDSQSTFVSNNGSNTTLEWQGKQTQTSAWTTGPCASGYRLPNRGEWETLQSYARANSSTISSLIGLQSNWAYQASRNTGGDITITSRLPVSAGYWTSTMDGSTPTVMHIGSRYAGYNTTGTDYGYVNTSSQWSYTDTGLELMTSTTGELANARCVRQ